MSEWPTPEPEDPMYTLPHEAVYDLVRENGIYWEGPVFPPDPPLAGTGKTLHFPTMTTIQFLDGDQELLTIPPDYWLLVFDSPEEIVDTYKLYRLVWA
jgi:hypothetical protein